LACTSGCRQGEDSYGFSESGTVPTTTDDASTGGAASSTSGGKLDLGGTSGMTANPESFTSGCAEVTATIEPVIPIITLLIDQSGSMSDPFGATTRWQAIYDALLDPTSGVVADLESTMQFGMTLYVSQNGMYGGTCPMLTEVAPAFDNRAAMAAAFSMPVVEGDTPTGESLHAVAMSLAALPDDAPKAIVLATDGEPDTCAVPDPQTGQPESVAAGQAAFALGVRTFIVSVGSEISADHLQHMANVGVGKAPDDANPAPYYEALDASQLVDAFDQIIGGFVSCEFQIEGEVEIDQACEGHVLLDGNELECGVQWDVPDPSTLVLLGDACATLQDGDDHTVEASFPCDVIDIP
jgi:hypothetical protein